MASTQKLTELPTIQYTGMDYTSVISQIQTIINDNKNWKSNWTQFYSSEAGVLLIQLMAWIADNLGVRQDLIYNENFLATATSNSAKTRLLNQIGYIRNTTTAAIVPIVVSLDKPAASTVNLSCVRKKENENDVTSIKSSILSFQAPDINGNSTNWEVLQIEEDGTINYEAPITLPSGNVEYSVYNKSGEEKAYKIKAVQGETRYKEFSSVTENGPVFNLEVSDFDLNSLVVYDLTDGDGVLANSKHLKVNSFVEVTSIGTANNIPCYSLERNDNGTLQIRYMSKKLADSNILLKQHKFKAGHKIGVFYRISAGVDGNIPENYWDVTKNISTQSGEYINIHIKNELAGYNGTTAETLEDAVQNGPLSLQTMDRAVTTWDFDKILQDNSTVLSSKSFSPDNMPAAFPKYFGRRIAPHEVFSIVTLNKNFSGIPNGKLNYYPWIETNKQHILNEKYNFNVCEINVKYNKQEDTLFGGILNTKNKNYSFINSYGDDGSYYYDFCKSKDGRTGKMFKNISIFKTHDALGSTITQEKIAAQEYKDNNMEVPEEIYQFKAKLHTLFFEGRFVNDIISNFFTTEDMALKTKNFTTRDNVMEMEYNACFTSENKYKDLYSVDCIEAEKMVIVFDDNFKVEVDLKKEDDINLFMNKFGHTGDFRSNVSHYYVKLASNRDFEEELKTMSELSEYTVDELIAYYNSSGIAEYRKGIKELIIEAYKEAFEDSNYEPIEECPEGKKVFISERQTSEEKIGETIDTTVSYFYIENEEGKPTDYIKEIKKVTKEIVSIENEDGASAPMESEVSGELEIFRLNSEKAKDTSDMVARANGNSVYQDLGLQFPKSKLSQNINGSEQVEDIESYPFFTDYARYDENGKQVGNYYDFQLAKFYRIKINGNIYAVRIDAYSISKAQEFYKYRRQRENGTLYYDFYKFPGVGKMWQPEDYNKLYVSNLELNGAKGYSVLPHTTAMFEDSNVLNCPNDAIVRDTKDFSVKYVFLTVDRLAALLEYLFSPENKDEKVIYKFVNNQWVDLRDYGEPVLDGGLRVSVVEKLHHNNGNCSKYYFSDEEYLFKDATEEEKEDGLSKQFYDNLECDIRFDYIFGENKLEISSVSETEFGVNESGETNDVIELNGVCNTSSDFLETLLGSRRKLSNSYVQHKAEEIVGFELDEEGTASVFRIKSPRTGNNSSIYFMSQRKEIDCILNIFGFNGSFNSIYGEEDASERKNEYNLYTNKAYGVRRMELFTGNPPADMESNFYMYGNASMEQSLYGVEVGDFLLTDNDLNLVNIPERAYLSYVLSTTDHLLINKQDNFYYSEDENSNKAAKPPIVGIEGQSVMLNAYDEYVINKNESDFKIKLTYDPCDSNSFYYINEDTMETLNAVKSNNVVLETDEVPVINEEGFPKRVPFVFGIDVTGDDYADVERIVTVDTVDVSTMSATKLMNAIRGSISTTETEQTEETIDLYKYRKNICKLAKDNCKKLVFTNVNKGINGNIQFYFPNSDLLSEYEADEDHVLRFYKKLFGTNITNPNLYNLYPPEVIKAINGNDDIIHYLNRAKTEYYYSPCISVDRTQERHLKFIYRTFDDEFKTSSRYADYHITCDGYKFHNNNSASKEDGYKFTIWKTKTSKFPDTGFYLHFVNDRTYEINRETEEDVINAYMKKHMIGGTKINYLNPYFKTFDIAGIIYYNANFDVTTVKNNVTKILENKYMIKNLENIEPGNRIYLSDINKTIMSVDGVEHVEITYFGFDKINSNTYPSQTKYLSLDEEHDFYTMAILADKQNGHGIQFSYEKDSATELN